MGYDLCTKIKQLLLVVCVLNVLVDNVHCAPNSDVLCEGPCPQTCQGVDVIHAGNIDSFKGCTVIDGSISIFNETFNGFQRLVSLTNPDFGKKYPGMHPDKLEAFSALKEVTGFVNIQGYHNDFRNLFYFRNLEVIGGQKLTFWDSALYIATTSLRSLGLKSLKRIDAGTVTMLRNPELCFADGIEWSKLMQKNTSEVYSPMLASNRAKDKCTKDDLICNEQCTGEGCWGPGPDQCLSCSNYQLKNGTCTSDPAMNACEGVPLIHSGNIHSFQNCTMIDGSITILEQSFAGFQPVYSNFSFGKRYPGMSPDQLEVFSTLKKVTGFIHIQGHHDDFRNLSYFRNLETIGGRTLTEWSSSLYIAKTSLESLGLRSLKSIHSGRVTIMGNADLCFVEGVKWSKLMQRNPPLEHSSMLFFNKAKDKCKKEGLVCDTQCSLDGCWGSGPDQCLTRTNTLEKNTRTQDVPEARKLEPKKLPSTSTSSEFVKGKICIGTNNKLSVPSYRAQHYKNLKDRYTNCTYVDGNLEITWLEDENLDFSFLANIREVTGYVLISHVHVKKIVLPKLQIIRGRNTFMLSVHEGDWSLLITLTKTLNVEMPKLRDILNGSVGILNNYNLCHIRLINWDEIIGPNAHYTYIYNFTSPERDCPPCDTSCTAGCWGEGPENCQKFSKSNCSPGCYPGRCFGPNPRDCCHPFCAGGCTGPKQSDCLACRNFYDDGECVQECPAVQKYNPNTSSWETNPHGKYAYEATCVKQCPEHLLRDNGACVRECSSMKRALNSECIACEGPCPKTCEGVPVVHAGNIDTFEGCTIIEGSITILEQSFKGFQQVYSNFSFGERYPEMHPDKLEIFSTLKEITGFVSIQGYHKDFRNLSYFRNLEVIRGEVLTEWFSSLYIVNTSLESLGLRSLKKIMSGRVTILENAKLCYAAGIEWSKLKQKKASSEEHPSMLVSNKAKEKCFNEGSVCDERCAGGAGCWGPGPDQCVTI